MLTTRRGMIGGAAALLGAASLGFAGKARAEETQSLVLAKAEAEILPGLVTQNIWGFGAGTPKVLRLRQGKPARIAVTNGLDEVTTVHWHGLRIPNAQDGVPYLSQMPIGVGEVWTYDYTPPDAGTYWFHPHCNTLEQIARGAAGVLVVDEAEDPGFDTDAVVELRDFRLGRDGQFIEFTRPRNAARGGTLGTVITANWKPEEVITAQAGSFLRLRLAVTDITRVYHLGVEGAEARVIALDGHPVDSPYAVAALPTATAPEPALPANTWPLLLAPGQRGDLGILVPAAGAEVQVRIGLPGGAQEVLVRIKSQGPSLNKRIEDLPVLPPNPVAMPDVKAAEMLDFVIGWSPEGTDGTSGPCGDTPYRFWSINRKLWPGEGPPDAANPLEPLAVLKQGQSYRFRLSNETQNDHPIHLHGMAFRILSPDRNSPPPVWADTVLLRSHETREIAFVADNPGDWVFHCHVIEHQKTGLAGLIRVV